MYHVSVMLAETVGALNAAAGKTYLDSTLGGGGHTQAILDKGARVAAIDRDQAAIDYCKSHVKGDVTYIKGEYENAPSLLGAVGITSIAGAVMDLGVSSKQLDDAERGFSYMHDGELDMRMDNSQGFSAYDVVNGYSQEDLARILRDYGEESFARRIAGEIVKRRATGEIRTTKQLADLIASCVPYRKNGHPAKKSFQAIRIEVNGELKGLQTAITGIFGMIERGGRLAVISFHSLEDRIVKNTFKDLATDCICPKSFPICVCNHRAEGKIISRERPSADELRQNPRSASATLRVIEKL